MLGIHSHQPVGNFAHVFRECYDKCYGPFVETLVRHPGVRVALHYSGPLFEWFEKNEPKYIDTIASLVERGQVEMLSGGFYEPILPIIPREDAIGQIEMMNDYIQRRFGQQPSGLWLTERVWEPHLPSLITEAGLKYTIFDENHFAYAGLKAKDMFGYYLTEDQGHKTAVFPIDKHLRYQIPFRLPEETFEYFRKLTEDGETKDITYGDDGEKFGVWPDTYKWVYTDGYLEKFFSMLEENSDWVKMPTFSEFIQSNPPVGQIYLPTASYDEMMEWALPPKATTEYMSIVKDLKDKDVYQDYRPYLRGGFWRNFLSKYPEANRMHKKMVHVSRKVNALPDNVSAEAKRELWRGQCNCPYWHGLFGGLYLNYLRFATYTHLIRAEAMALEAAHGDSANIHVEQTDFDCDGYEETTVSTADYTIYISPGYGGSIMEIDHKPTCFNITDVMGRRPEAYHGKIQQASDGGSEDGAQSIHDMVRVKEKGLEKNLFYDRHERRCFLDHLIPSDTTIDDFSRMKYVEANDSLDKFYELTDKNVSSGNVALTFERKTPRAHIKKEFVIDNENGVQALYDVKGSDELVESMLFGVELNLTLLAGDADDRYYEIPGVDLQENRMNSFGEVESVSLVRLVDRWLNVAIVIQYEPATKLWRFPIQTVSQSEGGFEKTYQGSCITALWPFSPQVWEGAKYSVRLKVEQL